MFRFYSEFGIASKLCATRRVAIRALDKKSEASIPAVFFINSRVFSSAPSGHHDNTQQGTFHKIAFIGSGRMAEALVAPLIKSDLQPSSKIAMYDVCTHTMDRVCDMYQVLPSSSIPECIHEADLICIAVKPQNCDVVFKEIRKAVESSLVTIHPDAALLSIVAGKPIKSFHETSISRIARSMPNTVS